MSLKERIKKEISTSRKAGNKTKVVILNTIIGEIQKTESSGQILDDIAIIKIFKRFLSNLNETVNFLLEKDSSDPRLSELILERVIYESFLPKKISEDSLRNIVLTHIETYYPLKQKSDMKKIMMTIKEKIEEMKIDFDGKIISSIVKEVVIS